MIASPSDTPELANPNMDWQLLSEINLPSQAGADQLAMELVARIIEDLHLTPGRLDQLKQAVAVATLNAAKNRNFSKTGLTLSIRVLTTLQLLQMQSNDDAPANDTDQPSIAGLENKVLKNNSLRSWGFFLIDKTIDDPLIQQGETRHRIELYIYPEGGKNAPRKGLSPG